MSPPVPRRYPTTRLRPLHGWVGRNPGRRGTRESLGRTGRLDLASKPWSVVRWPTQSPLGRDVNNANCLKTHKRVSHTLAEEYGHFLPKSLCCVREAHVGRLQNRLTRLLSVPLYSACSGPDVFSCHMFIAHSCSKNTHTKPQMRDFKEAKVERSQFTETPGNTHGPRLPVELLDRFAHWTWGQNRIEWDKSVMVSVLWYVETIWFCLVFTVGYI